MTNVKKNPYNKSIYGIGYIGEGEYCKSKYPKHYSKWTGIIRRCYVEKERYKHKTYINCEVCSEWLNFQIFSKWLDNNNFNGTQVIDKDLLGNGKLYSPKTCCLIPHRLNSQITTFSKKGCYWNPKNKNWRVEIKTWEGKRIGLGSFKNKEDAISIYIKHKHIELNKIVKEWELIVNENIITAIKNKIDIFIKQ